MQISNIKLPTNFL